MKFYYKEILLNLLLSYEILLIHHLSLLLSLSLCPAYDYCRQGLVAGPCRGSAVGGPLFLFRSS